MRLVILCRLLDGELAVSGFETELGLKQPSLSQQLGQLREAGLVATRRASKSVFYRLADARVHTVLAALRAAFGEAAEPVAAGPSPLPSPRDARPVPPAASPRNGRPAPRAVAQADSECGVFSSAGWPAP
jgi:ArsR family transcriptional regulator